MIQQFLENSAARFPEKIAVVHGEKQATYTEINNLASNLAGYLNMNGICKNDRVVILMENSIEYIIAYYGILKSGAVAAPFSHGIKPEGLQYLLDDLKPSAVITTFKSERLLKAVSLNSPQLKQIIILNPRMSWKGTGVKVTSFEESISDKILLDDHFSKNKDDLASIIYTSGSTGHPKGVMLSHGNIMANTSSICQYLCLTEQDIQMVVLPFFYVMGKSLLNTHFAVGGSIVINNRFIYPADVIKEMAEKKITGFSGVPSTYAYLLHRSPLLKFKDRLPALRYCSQAGGHMASQLKKELRSALPAHTDIFIMYGATEASARLTYLSPEQFENKIGSIGKAIPDVELELLDSDNNIIKDNTRGELVARGDNIMKGYWNDAEATRKALDDKKYYRTGDIAWRDDDGYYFIEGRKDNVLKVSGHKVNPQDIEECLMVTESLTEVVVIGLKDKLSGYRLAALCVSKDGVKDVKGLKKYCSEILPKYQVPSEFIFLKSLPKGASGKIDKEQCIDTYLKIKTKK